MYIRKNFLNSLVLAAGIIILTALTVLYCFAEIRIPAWCYAAGWLSCLYGMLTCTRRIGE